MDFVKSLALITLACLLIFRLRIYPFQEKKTQERQKTQKARLTGKRVESGTGQSGRSSGMGYSYVLTFRLESGIETELYAYEIEYGSLRENTIGTLTWKGPYFVSFETEVL